MLKLTHPIGAIASKILFIRGHKVMIDANLATFYSVSTRRLNEQVRRNSNRFPDDFMFQLTIEEKREVVANCDHLKNLKFSKVLPLAFTEHGAIQAANVLNSEQAAEIGVYVVRAFVRLRELLASNKDMAKKLEELERKLQSHDQSITGLIKTLGQMMEPVHTKSHRSDFCIRDDIAP